MKHGAEVGCVLGFVGGEAVETPAIGTPAGVGNCAVGALAGGAAVGPGFALDHQSDVWTELSLAGKEANAIANVIGACYP